MAQCRRAASRKPRLLTLAVGPVRPSMTRTRAIGDGMTVWLLTQNTALRFSSNSGAA